MAKKKVKRRTTRKAVKLPTARKSVPTGVKVISLLFYIVAALNILAGLFMVIGGILGTSVLSNVDLEQMIQQAGYGVEYGEIATSVVIALLVVVGLFVIALGLLYFFIGKGLWKGKKWAKIVAIVLLAIGFVKAVIVNSVLLALVYGVIGIYLVLSKKVKRAFA